MIGACGGRTERVRMVGCMWSAHAPSLHPVENAAANDGSIPDAVPLFPLGKPPPRRLRSVQKLTAFNQQALRWHESAAG